MEFRANIGIGFCREQIQRNESQMEWQVKLLKTVWQCSSRFVSCSIVRVPECVRVLLRQTRCSDDFFGANLNTVLAFRSRASFLHTSMILISLSHFKITRLRMIMTGTRHPQLFGCQRSPFLRLFCRCRHPFVVTSELDTAQGFLVHAVLRVHAVCCVGHRQ